LAVVDAHAQLHLVIVLLGEFVGFVLGELLAFEKSILTLIRVRASVPAVLMT
jgi:hypothetical protein